MDEESPGYSREDGLARDHRTRPVAPHVSQGPGQYDRTLVLEAEERFDAVIVFALQGSTRLDLGTRAALIEEAAALGIGSDRADRLIGRACRKLGVRRDGGPVAPLSGLAGAGAAQATVNGVYQQLRCRNCAGVTEVSPVARKTSPAAMPPLRSIAQMGMPGMPSFALARPAQVRMRLPHGAARAPSASFRRGPACLPLSRAGHGALHLEKVQSYAPHHVGARNGMAKIRQHAADIEYARMAWELAHAGKKLVAARQAVEAWRKLVDPSLPEVREAWKAVTSGLRQAQELAAQARKLERIDPAAARSLYRKSLDIAADLPEAQAGLSSCPPDPPFGLETQVLGDRVRLTWTPPSPDGLGPLTFAIMRKRGGLPKHPGDGTRIAEVSTTEYEDRHLKPGESVSYAVLAKRGETESLAAVAVGPLLYLPEVQDVRMEPRARGDRALDGFLPPACSRSAWFAKPVLPRTALAMVSELQRHLTRLSIPACGRTKLITTRSMPSIGWPTLGVIPHEASLCRRFPACLFLP